MKTVIVTIAIILLTAQSVKLQDDACFTAAPPYVITSNAPYTVKWLMEFSPDGFYLRIDAQPKLKLSVVIIGQACFPDTPNPGKIPHSYRSLAGLPRGFHTARLTAYNFVLGSDGKPTTVEKEGPAMTILFSAIDPVVISPIPMTPTNTHIIK